MRRARKIHPVVGLVALLLTLLCVEWAYAPMVRYSGTGNLTAINGLLSPSGFDVAGAFVGPGSGLFFSWAAPEGGVFPLDMKTPYGTFALPYVSEDCDATLTSEHPSGPGPHAVGNSTGLTFAQGAPIVFTFPAAADSAPSVTLRIEQDRIEIEVAGGTPDSLGSWVDTPNGWMLTVKR